MELNRGQETAISHVLGPMLVLAGPGSGKTFVITERTKYLIEQCDVKEENVLVITFTKAAANEMKNRFLMLIDKQRTKVNFGTFHSVFFTILKHAFGYNASNIIREDIKRQFFKDIIHKHNIEFEDENETINLIMSEISLVKGDRMELENYYSINCANDVFIKIYNDYEQKLRQNRFIDFDDMLCMTYDLFINHPKYLSLWQEKFKYILIDEFQDINTIQYKIIKMLGEPENNIFIVGDDDQSIYRFRGAKPEIMKQFIKDYPYASTTLLDKNYRSTSQIVEASLRLISHNKDRFQKKILANKDSGSNIDLQVFNTVHLENKSVINQIKTYHNKGIELSQMAILLRTNIGYHNLLYTLMEYNIPFVMKDAIPNIYDHWVAQDIITYIKISQGENNRRNYLRIINKPIRYVSRDCFDDQEVDLEELRKYYEDKNWMIERLDTLEMDIKMLENMSPYAAITYIRRGIGYEEYLLEYANQRRIKYDELIDILDEIQESAKAFKTMNDWFKHMEDYKEELSRQAKDNKEKEDVNIITMHGSKGLEFKIVFIIDVNEEIMPHKKAVLEIDIEEERRLFYVAMTRAKEFLHIYSTKERYNKELEPSRFIEEMITLASDELGI